MLGGEAPLILVLALFACKAPVPVAQPEVAVEPPATQGPGLDLPEGVTCDGAPAEVVEAFAAFSQASFEKALADAGLELTALQASDPPAGADPDRPPPGWTPRYDDLSPQPSAEAVRDASGTHYLLVRAPEVIESVIHARCECPRWSGVPPEDRTQLAWYRAAVREVAYPVKEVSEQFYYAPGSCPAPP